MITCCENAENRSIPIIKKHFDNINLDEMIFYYRKHFVIPNIFQKIKRLITILFYRFSYRNRIISYGNPDSIFLFSNEYSNRPDHIKYFTNVVDLVSNKIIIQGIRLFKLSKPKLKGVPISLFFSFLKELKLQGEEYYWELATRLYCILSDYSEIDKYTNKNNVQLKTFVSYCDFVGVDYFLVYKMNKKTINTITLQHGIYTDKNPQVFVNSHSKVFFAINKYSVDLMHKYQPDKLCEIVGMPQNINISTSLKKNSEINSKAIGVILDGSGYEDSNKKILNILNEFATNTDYDISVKFHPSSPEALYDKENISKSVTIVPSSGNIDELLNKADIGILCGSTCIMQLLFMGKPILLFDTNKKAFSNIPNELLFSNLIDFKNKLLSINMNSYKSAYENFRKNLIPDKDIKKAYIDSFQKYKIE